jgi:hypothetical protein
VVYLGLFFLRGVKVEGDSRVPAFLYPFDVFPPVTILSIILFKTENALQFRVFGNVYFNEISRHNSICI